MELQPFAKKLIQSWLHDQSECFFTLRHVFIAFYLHIFLRINQLFD
jgi:hypothetical protein